MRISCCELYARLCGYLDTAQTEPVIITRWGRDHAVLVSAEAFHKLRARASAKVRQMLKGGETVSVDVFRKNYTYCPERKLPAPVFVARKTGRMSVLLPRKAFDLLFQGDVPREPQPADDLQRIAVSDFLADIHRYLRLSRRRPLIIQKNDRDSGALLSAFAYRILVRRRPPDNAERRPLRAMPVSEFVSSASGCLNRLVSRPVLITFEGRDQNVLMSAKLFGRLFTDGRARLIMSGESPSPQYPAERRDKYAYADVLKTP